MTQLALNFAERLVMGVPKEKKKRSRVKRVLSKLMTDGSVEWQEMTVITPFYAYYKLDSLYIINHIPSSRRVRGFSRVDEIYEYINSFGDYLQEQYERIKNENKKS
jgi:hypothetical protein